ncbi:methyltransferase [Cellulomonas gilvus]|uniref:RNA methylase n=1 Tax=Cellulomonas gilvus (strain ATCC 13127 / NRRL B-14078) TaxID=593907 RepID=F8A782_CELGA|nr:methyltransferase [Cellulomonas gilvus]AEI13569.1 RNA methylase [Cellulomonas gilvus ATCC 13127]
MSGRGRGRRPASAGDPGRGTGRGGTTRRPARPGPAERAARPRRDDEQPAGRPRGERSAGRPAAGPPRPARTRVELTFLPGLGEVLADEAAEVLGARPRPVPGRDDALVVDLPGALADVRRLRTAVAAFVALHFDVPRPRALLSGDHLARIVAAAYASLRVAGSSTFRFEAAGADSSVFARLGDELASATGLRHDEQDGELVVKVRRGARRDTAAAEQDPGWDVLVRVGPRPLSARTWRVTDFPGAANATIAAAMVRLAGPRDDERVLNLMCGSGTLLVERLLAAPAAAAVGLDLADDALDAARDNLEAAGLTRRASLVRADALDPSSWPAGTAPADLILADPPWGTLHGSHADARAVHAGLLRAAHAAAAPGARLVVLTHEVKVMEQAVRDADALWRAHPPVRVFAKGHHPRIWLLTRP